MTINPPLSGQYKLQQYVVLILEEGLPLSYNLDCEDIKNG